MIINDDRAQAIARHYRDVLGREPDDGGLSYYHGCGMSTDAIRDVLAASEEGKRRRGEQAVAPVASPSRAGPKIAYCVMTLNRLAELREGIDRMRGHVDHIIVVDGGSQDDTIFWARSDPAIDLVLSPWRDNFPGQRNVYMRRARELGAEWVIVSDSDEHYCPDAARDMRSIVAAASASGHGGVEFRSVDMDYRGDTLVSRRESDFYKMLAIRLDAGLEYDERHNPHEALNRGVRAMRADNRYYYEHKKRIGVVAHRGARNFFVGGGGLNERPPKWHEFKAIVRETMGDIQWPAFDRVLVRGEVPDRVLDWMRAHKNDNERGGDSEVRELHELFFSLYHPERR